MPLSLAILVFRWIKFEEDVEEGGDRWSKPHVATISLHSLFELRSCILNGTVMLDLEASSLDQIADLVLENMVNAGQLSLELRDNVKENLLRRHRHQHEKKHDRGHDKSRLPNIRSLVDIGRSSSKSMFGSHSKCCLVQSCRVCFAHFVLCEEKKILFLFLVFYLSTSISYTKCTQ